MIELDLIRANDHDGFYGDLWTDETNMHVIVEEDGLWYVRDEEGEHGGAHVSFNDAFTYATTLIEWVDATLAPANRLRSDIETGRTHTISDLLLEYLAIYGAIGIDVQVLAKRVFERQEEEE